MCCVVCIYICTYILTSNTYTRRMKLFAIYVNKIDTRPNPPLHIEWDGQRGWPHCFWKWKGIAFPLLCVNWLAHLKWRGTAAQPAKSSNIRNSFVEQRRLLPSQSKKHNVCLASVIACPPWLATIADALPSSMRQFQALTDSFYLVNLALLPSWQGMAAFLLNAQGMIVYTRYFTYAQ